MKKVLTTVLAIMLAIGVGFAGHSILSQPTTAYAEENAITAEENVVVEEKSYCQATLEDDFADDRVLVALNRTATMRYKKYTPDDFAEIGCISKKAKKMCLRQLTNRDGVIYFGGFVKNGKHGRF